MNYLLYLSFGGTDYYNETLFSLLSYYRLHSTNETEVVIYTDNTGFFRQRVPYSITLIPLPQSTLEFWKGTHKIPYRVKIKVLQDATDRLVGNILYVDTDTVFRRNTASLFQKLQEGIFLMDACEGHLKDNRGGIARKVKCILETQNTFEHPVLPEPVVLDQEMKVWNSGSVGFNTVHAKNKLTLAEALADTLYDVNPLYVMEQIAIGYYLSKGNIEETKSYIDHYWYFKEFRKVLRQFFNAHEGEAFEVMAVKAARVDPWVLSEAKRTYKQKSFWQKQWHKLVSGEKWDVPDYKPN